ncbi:DedA family protein [Microbacterium sp. Marseille-Q6965]|uniref:DedA family protein n=1 Tax=Microbacterium sp. Marseille-Q6965 TaxID=2965072 RepID=UPI0021B76F3E|nr:DedA family protein [Microbacterium sp. Marseille-Q6965]
MHLLQATTTSGSDGWLSGLVDWLVGLMDLIGPVGAGIAIAAENIFPPIPSEAILPLAGLAASRGSFAIWEAILWTTIGSLAGALLLYGIGAWFGVKRLVWIAERVPLLRADDVHRTVAWFEKHGPVAVFFGRFVPIFRSLISIPAGVVRMPLWKFALYTGGGSLIWNTIFVLVGYFLGESWHVVEQYMDIAQNVVIVVVVAAVAVFVWLRVRQILRDRRERQPREE